MIFILKLLHEQQSKNLILQPACNSFPYMKMPLWHLIQKFMVIENKFWMTQGLSYSHLPRLWEWQWPSPEQLEDLGNRNSKWSHSKWSHRKHPLLVPAGLTRRNSLLCSKSGMQNSHCAASAFVIGIEKLKRVRMVKKILA